ncbi:MAG: hypothetical protein M3O50_10490, partial [Myxococcota bacterium]|nr:hypothetical protein [Myxococcota bacterium]
RQQGAHFARAAAHFERAGDDDAVLESLIRAADVDPTADEHTARLVERFGAAGRWIDVAQLLVRRAERLTDRAKRVAARREAAILFSSKLQDKDQARANWLNVLDDGDDKEALEHLAADAVERQDPAAAATLLRRLGDVARDPAERAAIALREAEILAEGLGDVDAAIARYEYILDELEPACRPALQAVADLQEARDQPAAAANALERELKLVTDPAERAPIASRLARLYEQLEDPASAIRALELVRTSDPDDLDALVRLYDLCEKTRSWERAAELLAQRIEVEGDEAEAGVLTRKLARILADELDRGDEALAALTELADAGNQAVRAAYVELGDRLGWRGIVATKLVEWWFEAKPGPERTASLRGAFERFAEVGREQDAVHVACEVVRSKGGDHELAERLEQLSVKTKNLDSLAIAHDLLARELTGMDRARELARQAETRVKAGATAAEALQHGESGLTGVPPSDAEEILLRLAELAGHPAEIIDLYERQIGRAKAPVDRVRALARAAQVGSLHDDVARARGFFDLALAGTPTPDALSTLEEAARTADAESGDDRLRRALCAALAAGGQGSRDGGRMRGSLIRRAAAIIHAELGDVEQAFVWLGEALIAHVEPATLDALEALSIEVSDPRRAEATLSRALGEVFDGPLVRQLLARRAKIRRDDLNDPAGAATDLKKLHELSPTDQGVADELSAVLGLLGDYPAMVQLYEDLILRGKDLTIRTDLARKVARMWEEQLDDPREAADAWRRVLRMKPGDGEATAGLERAKSNMLRRREASDRPSASAPASATPLPPQSGDPTSFSPVPPAASHDSSSADGAREMMATLPPDGDESPVVAQAARPATPIGAVSQDAAAKADQAGLGERAAEDEVLVADDVAEMIDDDERAKVISEPPPPKPAPTTPPKRRKRSVPPPLPRE